MIEVLYYFHRFNNKLYTLRFPIHFKHDKLLYYMNETWPIIPDSSHIYIQEENNKFNLLTYED